MGGIYNGVNYPTAAAYDQAVAEGIAASGGHVASGSFDYGDPALQGGGSSVSTAASTPTSSMALSAAVNLFQLDLGAKEQYDAYAQGNPGASYQNDANLAYWHNLSLGYESQLRAAGYADAADILVSEDYPAAQAWLAENPTLGTSAVQSQSGGSSTGTTTQLSFTPGQGSSEYGTGPTEGGGSTAAGSSASSGGGFLGWLGGLLGIPSTTQIGQGIGQGIGAAVGSATEGAFAGAGYGIGVGAQQAGAGVGSGLSSAIQQAGSGIQSIGATLFWPIVIVLGILTFGKVYRIRKGPRTS
ncbi:MAG: hypothetical protein ACYCW6_25635 [Candidatus Xenobia bacterium]